MKKTDPRVIRTRKLIINTFYELAKRKNFEEISIADITKKAEINRSTFYYHFEDKYNLIDAIQHEVIIKELFKDLEKEDTIDERTVNKIIKAIIDSHTGLSPHCQSSYDILKPKIEEDIKNHLTMSLHYLLNKINGENSNHFIKATFWSWGIYGVAISCLEGDDSIEVALPKVMKIMNLEI